MGNARRYIATFAGHGPSTDFDLVFFFFFPFKSGKRKGVREGEGGMLLMTKQLRKKGCILTGKLY